MTIETEERWGTPSYELQIMDSTNGVALAAFNFDPSTESTEAEFDETFQKLVDLIAGHEDLTVLSAKKNISNRSIVTVTP